MKKLENQIALVTGASRGIGQEIAARLAQEGADIVIDFRSSDEGARETLRRVEAAGRRGHIVKADLGRVAEIEQLVAAGSEHFGRIDLLVNNAGIERRADFWDVTEEDFDAVLDVNLKGVFFTTQAFVRALRTSGRKGKIINISSVHEELPFPHFASYCAAKGGLKMLMRNLSIELAPLGITINNIAPGAIGTAINKDLLADKPKLDALLQNIPLRRLGTPEEVAALVAFLASSEADYITGATFTVDGGLTWNYEEQ